MATDLARLIKSLGSDKQPERQAAADELLRMGADAAPAALALVGAADSDDETRNLATGALEDLGKPPIEMTTALAAALKRPTLDGPYWAATLLGRLKADAAPAVKSLADATARHPQITVRQRATWALGEIGAAASPALETLEQVSTDADPRLARLASEAMAKIRE